MPALDESLLTQAADDRLHNLLTPLLLPFWIPNFLYLLSYGAGMVALPLFLLETLDVSYVYVGGYKVVQELAELLANNPSASAVSRWGWKGSIFCGGAGFLIASVLLFLASLLPSSGTSTTYVLFLFAYFLQCGSMKFFGRGNAILTSELSSQNRGRFSSLQAAGRYCMGAVGSLMAGLLMSMTHSPRVVFATMIGIGAAALLSISASFTRNNAFKKDKANRAAKPEQLQLRALDTGYGHFYRDAESFRELCTVSAACLIIVILRGCFHMMIPIQGHDLGLNVHLIAFVFVVCNSCGLSLFWIGGLILDTLGRRWSAVPACAFFSAAFVLLGLAHGTASMCVAACFFGFGETISGGVKSSLKADFTARAMRHRLSQTQRELRNEVGDCELADAHKVRFSAMIDNVLDASSMLYPIVLTQIAQAFSPSAACFCFGLIGAIGVLMFSLITETLTRSFAPQEKLVRQLKVFLASSSAVLGIVFTYVVVIGRF